MHLFIGLRRRILKEKPIEPSIAPAIAKKMKNNTAPFIIFCSRVGFLN